MPGPEGQACPPGAEGQARPPGPGQRPRMMLARTRTQLGRQSVGLAAGVQGWMTWMPCSWAYTPQTQGGHSHTLASPRPDHSHAQAAPRPQVWGGGHGCWPLPGGGAPTHCLCWRKAALAAFPLLLLQLKGHCRQRRCCSH